MRFLAVLLASLAAAPLSAQAPAYDLLLQGGHVIDAKNDVDAIRDVAIKDGKIAAIAENIPAASAKKAIQISGLYLTPGLVDMHVHVFWGNNHSAWKNGDLSLPPDAMSFRVGVTTMVDAGSSGWRDFPEFRRRIIDHAATRVLAFVNIVGDGMANTDDAAEQNEHDMDPAKIADLVRANPDIIVGIKTAHWQQPNFISVQKAEEVAKLTHLPVMVDFGFFNNKSYEEMVSHILQPGDISTHVFRMPAPLLDKNGHPAQFMLDARKRGIKFDVGHGGGSFHLPLAEPMIQQGFYPDSISTDLHISSANGPMIDILSVMSKIMALGVPLNEVIRETTANPAAEIRHPELGQIAVGSIADIAILRVDKGDFGFTDIAGGRVTSHERLGCEMTLRAGRIVYDFNGRAGVPWHGAKLPYPTQ